MPLRSQVSVPIMVDSVPAASSMGAMPQARVRRSL